jgi:hypothetical protein
VQLGMAARGIACSSKRDSSDRIAMQVPAFKLPACSRVTLVFYRTRTELSACVHCSGDNAHPVKH